MKAVMQGMEGRSGDKEKEWGSKKERQAARRSAVVP